MPPDPVGPRCEVPLSDREVLDLAETVRARGLRKAGRPAKCFCGVCPTCRMRAYQRDRRRRLHAAAAHQEPSA